MIICITKKDAGWRPLSLASGSWLLSFIRLQKLYFAPSMILSASSTVISFPLSSLGIR